MRTLVVHGDESMRSELCQALSQYGIVETTRNGREAVQLFADRFATEDRYGLLVVDYDLKVLNGFETIAMIRMVESDHPETGNTTPIVLYSDGCHVKSTIESDSIKDKRLFFQSYPINFSFLNFLAEKISREFSVKPCPRSSRTIRQVNISA